MPKKKVLSYTAEEFLAWLAPEQPCSFAKEVNYVVFCAPEEQWQPGGTILELWVARELQGKLPGTVLLLHSSGCGSWSGSFIEDIQDEGAQGFTFLTPNQTTDYKNKLVPETVFKDLIGLDYLTKS